MVNFWSNSGQILVNFWSVFSDILVNFWWTFGELLVIFWCNFGLFFGDILVNFWRNFGQHLVESFFIFLVKLRWDEMRCNICTASEPYNAPTAICMRFSSNSHLIALITSYLLVPWLIPSWLRFFFSSRSLRLTWLGHQSRRPLISCYFPLVPISLLRYGICPKIHQHFTNISPKITPKIDHKLTTISS